MAADVPQASSGADQVGVVVPLGFLAGLFGSLAGGVIGRAVGGERGSGIGSTIGGVVGGFLPLSADPAQAAVDPDARDYTEWLRGQAKDKIQDLRDYLARHVPRMPELAQCAEPVAQAGELYGRGDYARAVARTMQAYSCIRTKVAPT
jgi:hypothetical protein